MSKDSMALSKVEIVMHDEDVSSLPSAFLSVSLASITIN